MSPEPLMLQESPKVWPCGFIALGMFIALAAVVAFAGYAIGSAVS